MSDVSNKHGWPPLGGPWLGDMPNDDLAKYPKDVAERAMFTKDYEQVRKETIKEFDETIARGVNVDACKEEKQYILEHTPAAPPVDPTVPSNLDSDVLWRLRVLKYSLRPYCDEQDMANVNQIVDAYCKGDLKVLGGMVTVWFAGHMVIGPIKANDPVLHQFAENVPKWRDKYGPGRVWIEKPFQLPM